MEKISNHARLKFSLGLLLAVTLFAAAAQEQASEAEIANVSHGGQASLRGLTELDATRKADLFKPVPRDRSPYVSDYVFQPPLIPHKIRGYELSTNANKCLSCHSFKKSAETGATKISVTHYETRDGQVLSDVSPRRYFCLQCHVVQTDTRVLIENTFQRVESLQ
ncbi:MAG: Nitrate reductase cytochrome c550-type subunit [Olavius algarvensis Gamma 3 endosymbiont]|nr:MAG: Nitrate reductase cytochrome c550-type subunit [Olavius algarvensis Gamma 3 endosymbiont]